MIHNVYSVLDKHNTITVHEIFLPIVKQNMATICIYMYILVGSREPTLLASDYRT